jgi:mannosyltransferase
METKSRGLPVTSVTAVRGWKALAALTVLGGVLRFATLGLQSYWFDESVTVDLIRRPFLDLWSGIEGTESTPPLYYFVAWAWSHLFGTGEFALRSLSAAAGTAAIPAAYAAGAELFSRRTALLGAALVASSPLLVWYSQEARSYSLFVLVSSLSLAFFARTLRAGDARNAALWAACSTAAVWTHYFGVFLVAGEALFLIGRAGSRRVAVAASAASCAALLPLLPIVRHQERLGHTAWIAARPLRGRFKESAFEFLVGRHSLEHGTLIVLAFCAIVAAYLVWATTSRERSALVDIGVPAGLAVALPLLAAGAGKDYWYYRNLIGAWTPLAIIVAAVLTTRLAGWSGPAVGVGAALGSLAASVAVFATPSLQRDDWRGLASCLGPPSRDRLIVLRLGYESEVLRLYDQRLRVLQPGVVHASELLLVRADETATYNVAGFRRVPLGCSGNLPVVRLASRQPRPVDVHRLVALIPHGEQATAFVESAGNGRHPAR